MTDDYIELTDPNEVIREGDILLWVSGARTEAECMVGQKLGETVFVRIERPRSTVIRDAAVALLRACYGVPMNPIVESVWPEAKALREALGYTVEELRGER